MKHVFANFMVSMYKGREVSQQQVKCRNDFQRQTLDGEVHLDSSGKPTLRAEETKPDIQHSTSNKSYTDKLLALHSSPEHVMDSKPESPRLMTRLSSLKRTSVVASPDKYQLDVLYAI